MEKDWRKGYPKHTDGLGGYYVFEVLMNDLFKGNWVTEAYTKEDRWYKLSDKKEIPSDEIIGWKETYDCKTAGIAINEYVRKGGFGISSHNFGDALHRHIKMDSDEFITCEACWNYYLEKSGRKDETFFPEKLVGLKELARNELPAAP